MALVTRLFASRTKFSRCFVRSLADNLSITWASIYFHSGRLWFAYILKIYGKQGRYRNILCISRASRPMSFVLSWLQRLRTEARLGGKARAQLCPENRSLDPPGDTHFQVAIV